MPKGDNISELNARLLAYGKAGLRKTWWAMEAAKYGFNPIVFDGDRGGAIASKLDPAIRGRIDIINCGDTVSAAQFANIVLKFVQNETIVWDDVDNKALIPGGKWKPDHAHYVLDMSKLTKDDVLILDSWDALMTSIQHTKFKEDGEDVFASKVGDLRGVFGYQSRIGTAILNKLRALPCQVIVIAHEAINEITEPKYNEKKDQVDRIPTGEIYTQPLSSSRAHGQTLSDKFTDVLYFYMRGPRIRISTKPDEEREGKSRLVYVDDEWEKVTFKQFTDALGYTPQGIGGKACMYYPAGESPQTSAQQKATSAPLPQQEVVPSGQNNPLIGTPAASAGTKPNLLNLGKKG